MSRQAPAVMICGHGSRDADALGEFSAFAERLTKRLSAYDVESGSLQYSEPRIADGLRALKHRGAKRVVCLPGMLFAAGHVKNDLPAEVNAFTAVNPDVEVILARELGVDAKLLRLAAERISEAENAASTKRARKDSLLLVVGRGSSDSDANSNICKVTRMLWEGLGFGWAETAFSGVVEPDIAATLAKAFAMGYGRVVVMPYFLFTGVQVKGVRREAGEAAARHPQAEVLIANHLGGHDLLAECFADRLREALSGDNLMNCQTCEARERIIGDAETPI